MDAQAIRRALADFFRFNPSDFIVRGSPTGYLVSAIKKSSAAAAAPYCYLGIYNASTEEDPNQVSLRWGTINGIQPTGFNTRGLITPISISNPITYIYAKVTFDLAEWTVVTVEIAASGTVLVGTSTIGYILLGVVEEGEEEGDPLSIATNCGNVVVDICDLADPPEP